MQVGTSAVQRPDTAIRDIAEDIGRKKRRRQQHQREKTGHADEHSARGKLVREADDHRVTHEHEAEDRDQGSKSQIDSVMAERAREPVGHHRSQ